MRLCIRSFNGFILGLMLLSGCQSTSRGPAPVAEIPVKNLNQDGRYYIGGAPTAQGLKQLKEQGVLTIIDVRLQSEVNADEVQTAQELGMTYVNIPMKPDEMTSQQADEFLLRMSGTGDSPVLIHCAGGNRAAAMYGLHLGASGACSADEAVDRARRAGLKNKDLAEDLRTRLESKDQHDLPPHGAKKPAVEEELPG